MADSTRMTQFQNKGKEADTLKKNRIDEVVSIRKDKRNDLLSKRRNINVVSNDSEDAVPPPRPTGCSGRALLMDIVTMAQRDDVEQKLAAVQQIRKLLSSDRNPPIDDLIGSGILPFLVTCLSSENVNLQFEAAWALTNIATGRTKNILAVIRAGAVPLFLNLLQSGNMNVREQVVWGLGNIIGEGPKFRNYCIKRGIVCPLLKFIDLEIPVGFLRKITHVIINLCRFEDGRYPLTPEIVKMLLPALVLLLRHTNTDILMDTEWALTHLTDGGNEQIQMIIESGAVQSLIPLLDHSNRPLRGMTLMLCNQLGVTGDKRKEREEAVAEQKSLNMRHSDTDSSMSSSSTHSTPLLQQSPTHVHHQQEQSLNMRHSDTDSSMSSSSTHSTPMLQQSPTHVHHQQEQDGYESDSSVKWTYKDDSAPTSSVQIDQPTGRVHYRCPLLSLHSLPAPLPDPDFKPKSILKKSSLAPVVNRYIRRSTRINRI